MAVEGAIAERTRGILPITWDALMRDPRYGDALLQPVIDTAKESVFGSVMSVAAEDNQPLVVIDYVAKIAALELIPAGIDFWMNQSIAETTRGTNEVREFESRAQRLMELRKALLEETRSRLAEIIGLVGYRRNNGKSVPRSSTMDDEFLTASPQEFPRAYARTGRS